MVADGVCLMHVVSECKELKLDMERDMDFIRELLICMEKNPQLDGTRWMEFDPSDVPGRTREEIAYHIRLLATAGFVRANIANDFPAISSLTWDGHEFLDNIKDNGVWESTKARLAGLPAVALTVVAKIAEAEIMKRLHLS
jgi:hypothetical protein